MNDEGEWTPRPHDHLVEPVFAAVRAPDGGASRPAPRRGRRLVLLALLVGAAALALAVWWLARLVAT